jgi:hypothetical protein
MLMSAFFNVASLSSIALQSFQVPLTAGNNFSQFTHDGFDNLENSMLCKHEK